MGSTGAQKIGSGGNTVTTSQAEVPAEYRVTGGEDARNYFEYGGYTSSYTVDQFVRDSRTVDLYMGIDFERSGSAYYQQGVEYNEARKRWSKQIQYNRTARRDGIDLVSMSSNKLKTLYNQSSSDEVKRRIAAEMNSRGFYMNNGKWKTRGGGR